MPNIKHILAIASGKGGVGKSTVSVYLSFALAELKLKIGLLDLDLTGPNIPEIMKCDCKPDVIDDKIYPISSKGIKYLSMGSLIENRNPIPFRGAILHKLVQQFFNNVTWGDLDVLIVDLPPGTHDIHLSLLEFIKINSSIFVTNPSSLSKNELIKTINLFKKFDIPSFGLIENMSHYICSSCNEKNYLFGISSLNDFLKEYSLKLLSQIPIDTVFYSGKNEKAISYFKDIAEEISGKIK